MAAAQYVLNDEALRFLLESPDGPVGFALGRIGQDIVNIAKVLVPVDTGRLRNSITWQLGQAGIGLFVIVGTNVEYAAHVEFGTVYQVAQPYLVPALLRVGVRFGS